MVNYYVILLLANLDLLFKSNPTLESYIPEGQSLRKLYKVKDNCSQQKSLLAITAKALRNM